MTLAMDIRLASTAAKFGFVFARRGIVPEACSSYFFTPRCWHQQGIEWVLLGTRLSCSGGYGRGITA